MNKSDIWIFGLALLLLLPVVGIVWYACGYFPPQVAIVGGGIYVVLGLILPIFYSIISTFVSRQWSNAKLKAWALLISFGIALIITIVPIVYPKPSWNTILEQQKPDCTNPAGVAWNPPGLDTTSYSCTSSGLLMRQLTSGHYGELDLIQVNNTMYNQTDFRVQVQVLFKQPGDSTTSAGLLIQSPQNGCGGLIFILSPNGQWQLQDILDCSKIEQLKGGILSFQPSQLTTITAKVESNALQVSLNDEQVFYYNDGLNPFPGVVGLMVERQNQGPSSEVLFSNFQLDIKDDH